MVSFLKTIAKRSATALPYIGKYCLVGHAPGHYYSPVPDIEEVKAGEGDIWRRENSKGIPGIELNEQAQLQLLEQLSRYYPEQPFRENKTHGRRYYFENPFFSYSDAIFYYSLLRHLRPKRVIEIGSGFSSCVLLDTNELFFDSAIRCTFIDPEPQRLQSLLKPTDSKVDVIAKRVQDIDTSFLTELSAGDILFIDSSHVSKTGSDVNMILFELLPALKAGVYIHVHDAFYPFEYPREFVYRRWAWNELYLLRAFLSYNRDFRIAIFPSFLERFHGERLRNALPLAVTPYRVWQKITGASLWLERVQRSD